MQGTWTDSSSRPRDKAGPPTRKDCTSLPREQEGLSPQTPRDGTGRGASGRRSAHEAGAPQMGSGPVTESPQSSWELCHVRTQDESAAQRRPSPDLTLPASRTSCLQDCEKWTCAFTSPVCGVCYMSWNDGDRREYRSGCCVTKPPKVEVTVGLGGGAEAGRAGGGGAEKSLHCRGQTFQVTAAGSGLSSRHVGMCAGRASGWL